MRTNSKLLSLPATILLCLLSIAGTARAASETSCRITDVSPEKRTLTVTCLIASATEGRTLLRFLDQFAGIEKLSERIVAIRLRDANGSSIPLEIRGGGLFSFNPVKAARPIELRYEVRLSRALEPGRYALTSSLGPEGAFLLAADIFPEWPVWPAAPGGSEGSDGAGLDGGFEVEIVPPEGWQVATTEPANGARFVVSDRNRAVFFLGRMRTFNREVGGIRLQVAVAGAWEFSDQRIVSLCEAIAQSQAAMLDGREDGNFLVTLAPFPLPLTGLRSAGLARGNAVILMLNPGNDAARTLKHYERHLAHEMLHFYLPNAFRIRENFDWFWEGFTRYLALVTLVRTGNITFNELLGNVGDEYDAYSVNPLRGATSLIAASPEKFSDGANYEIVYRKGMVVAALYDLELRWQTRGKESLSGIVKKLYQGYARGGREVGNREVLSELSRAGNLTTFIADYIEGVSEIALPQMVEPYGVIIERSGDRGRARLAVGPRLSERQKALFGGFQK